MQFREIPPINVGIYVDYTDFNVTQFCMRNAFDRENINGCKTIPGMWPTGAGALMFFPGLPIHPLPISAVTEKILINGTNETIDMWATGAGLTLDWYKDYLYTSPYSFEKYGVLIKRQKMSFDLNVWSVTADIKLNIYAILFALLFFLFLIACINERLQRSNERNSIWHLLLALLPCNGQMWPQQTGVTRKVLMATSGFAILVWSSLYQAKYSEQLMVPYPPLVFTLEDIEMLVSSGRSKLLFDNEKVSIIPYIKQVAPNLLKANQTKYIHGLSNYTNEILLHNHIAIDSESTLLNYLENVEPHKCQEFTFIKLDQWRSILSVLVIDKKREDILESMNAIVAERLSFVDNYIQTLQLSDECRKHILPEIERKPSYSAIEMLEISFTLTLWISFLFLSIFVLLLELILHKYTSEKKTCVKEWQNRFVLHAYFDENLPLHKQELIVERCKQIHFLMQSEIEMKFKLVSLI